MLKIEFRGERIDYDGSQLSERWIYRNFGIEGDACVSFIGGCNVKPEYMADLEDLRDKREIKARLMVHFVSEIFSVPPMACPFVQRCFVSVLKEMIEEKTGIFLKRVGDDLFFEGRKLTVSIAIPATVSSLIHIGVNVDGRGAPLEVSTIAELGISPEKFAEEGLERIRDEFSSSLRSLYKVRTGR